MGCRYSVATDKTVCISDSDIGQTLLHPLEGHESDVICVVYTPDGRKLVTASADSTMRVWDVTTGEQVGEPMKSHRNNIIWAIAISPDGTFLATAGAHPVVQIWNLETHQLGGPPLRHANDVSWLDFSSDGRYLISGCCDFKIWLWDAIDVLSRPSSDVLPPSPKAAPALPLSPFPPLRLTSLPSISPAMVPLPPSPTSSNSIQIPFSGWHPRPRSLRNILFHRSRTDKPSFNSQRADNRIHLCHRVVEQAEKV
ncbi:quinon protein alcohol dehydrogenase-like superfamily [Chiua virens]|nr:quinon protein alcohol dehydrogenase-like superfamily [Chiua virens]